jgi:7-cyano-7-deazaguanine synthase
VKTVVLLSGGLDSAVALAGCYEEGLVDIHTLTVDYGQRHVREIDAARALAKHYKVPHAYIEIDPILFSGSALTGGADVPEGHADEPDATFVPGRNTVLIALATAYAESIGAGNIVIGANADDAGGYPDCRRKFIESYRDTISVGTDGKVWLHAPLLSMSKAEIVFESRRLGVPVNLTWSCYRGGETPCGRCGACMSLMEAEWANVPSE